MMFSAGIRSERLLMETVHLNLAHRWYIGYDLAEPVSDHSSLTKICDRYGLATFQRFFEQVVELCVRTSLAWSKELYVDGTKVPANVDIDILPWCPTAILRPSSICVSSLPTRPRNTRRTRATIPLLLPRRSVRMSSPWTASHPTPSATLTDRTTGSVPRHLWRDPAQWPAHLGL